MSEPIVSVIVPTKNSSNTLEACLKSIHDQSYKHIELIVVDNFSTDSTPEIAKRYTKHVYSKGPERSPQRNFGVSKATGTYVAIIDSDMNLSKNVIEEAVAKMISNLKLVGIIIPEESFGEGFWAQCKKLERSFYVGVSYMEAARFFKKNDYISVGGYNSTMVSGEDWDLSQRIEQRGLIEHIKSYIYHNEGHISLWRSVRKKFYYAEKFAQYATSNKTTANISKQTGLVSRYTLFFSQPKKLLRQPLIGLGMLFMKTCEFSFGAAGYLRARLHRK